MLTSPCIVSLKCWKMGLNARESRRLSSRLLAMYSVCRGSNQEGRAQMGLNTRVEALQLPTASNVQSLALVVHISQGQHSQEATPTQLFPIHSTFPMGINMDLSIWPLLTWTL